MRSASGPREPVWSPSLEGPVLDERRRVSYKARHMPKPRGPIKKQSSPPSIPTAERPAVEAAPAELPATPDPVSGGVRQLLALFQEQLQGVEFPEVSTAILKSAATELREKVASLEAMRVQLAAAELAVQNARTDLKKLADRGLAYAHIYATDRIDLQAKLAEIRLEASAAPIVRKPRKTRDAGGASSPAREPVPIPGTNGEE